MFHIILKKAFVAGCLRCPIRPPSSESTLHAIFESADVHGPIGPRELSVAVWLPLAVLSRVDVVVTKLVGPCPVLETVRPLPLIPVPVLPGVNPVAMRFRLKPFTDVGVSLHAPPNAVAFLKTPDPTAIVHFPVGPRKYPSSFCLAVFEVAVIAVAVGVAFKCFAIPDIVAPHALVLATICIFADPFSVALPVLGLAYIDGPLEAQLLAVAELFKVYFIGLKNYIRELHLGTTNESHI